MTIAADTPMLTAQDIRNVMQDEFTHFLSDIEFRVAQAYDVTHEHRTAYAEDININQFLITGYTVTANSPAAGSIAWASVVLVYNAVQYTITNANSANRYVWFDAATSTTVLQSSNTKPTLSGNATLVFINNAGTPISVLESNSQGLPAVVRNNAIDTLSIQDNAVNAAKVTDGSLTSAQLATNAGILGTQVATNAGLLGSQLAANAGLVGSQLSAAAGIAGTQLTNGTIGSTQLGTGAVTPLKTALFTHLIY